ncbi:SRPBCC family protein [Granulicella arctica]|uniref:SRPBCC family protein n=1 Tax=Granulicella arctica TaxID=940613 RepID=UPI0037BEEA3B
MKQTTQTPDPRIVWPREHRPESATVFTRNIIEIAASPDAVWALLTNCVRWPTWYKHCSDLSILRGGRLLGPDSKFRFKTLGFYGEPEITAFQLSQMLAWSAKGPPGLVAHTPGL